MELEKGRLYQVSHGGNWVIAEYGGFTKGGIVTGFRSRDGATRWHEPAQQWWREIPHRNHFRVPAKGMQVRPVTDSTLVEIERLKAEIQRLGKEQQSVIRELRQLCA